MAMHTMKDLWIDCLLDEKIFSNNLPNNPNDNQNLTDYYFSIKI